MALFRELQRRNVFRVAAAYVVSAWLLIEVSATLEDTLHLPEWADSLFAFFLILGFPVALFFSWAYEITPEGIRKEKDIGPDDTGRGTTASKLNRAIVALLVVAVAYFAFDEFVVERRAAAPPGDAPALAGDQAGPATAPGDAGTTPTAAVSSRSIAVLPFINMSSDPEQEYFSDGLTEELLNLLAKIPELKVAARTSSFYYKERMHDIPFREIGRQLEVAHLLEGSVRKGGDQIRITAQLIKADDGFHLWSETWDRTLDDVFAIQDEIAAAVAEQLRITLLDEAPHAQVIDTRSWELAQQARYFFNRRATGDLERAFTLYREAVEIDPDNADAWAMLSPLYRWVPDPPDHDRSFEAAQRALELDPENAVAHARIAPLYFRRGNVEKMDEHMLLALDHGRDSPAALSIMSGWAAYFGEHDFEILLYERALRFDPLHHTNLNNLANTYTWQKRFPEAQRVIDRLAQITTEPDRLLGARAEIALLSGDPETALDLMTGIVASSDEPSPTSGTPYIGDLVELVALHRLGRLASGEEALADFERRWEGWDFGIAMAQAALGFDEAALTTLQDLYAGREEVPGNFLNAPYLESLHDDPRWRALEDRAVVMPDDLRALMEEVLSE